MERDKLSGYLLNAGHDLGRHKARLFAGALGFSLGREPEKGVHDGQDEAALPARVPRRGGAAPP